MDFSKTSQTTMVELQSLFWVSVLKGEQVLQNLGKDAADKERERERESEREKARTTR